MGAFFIRSHFCLKFSVAFAYSNGTQEVQFNVCVTDCFFVLFFKSVRHIFAENLSDLLLVIYHLHLHE